MVDYAGAAWVQGAPFWAGAARPERDSIVRDRPILATLTTIVERHGARTAMADQDGSLDFAGLWRLVGGIAAAMSAEPGAGGLVGVMLPANRAYHAAVLACLVAGRPSVLLDASAPAARNAELLGQTGATLVLEWQGGGGAPGGELGGARRLRIGASMSAAMPAGWRPDGFDVDRAAFILCTSGSTGRPKAIVHSQRTMMHWAWWHMNAIGIEAGDLCLSLSPPATLGGINGMLAFAASGAGTHVVDLRQQGFAGLVETLLRRPVTSLRAAPSLLRMLPGLPDASTMLSGLRNVTTYGEPILRSDIAGLRRCLPPSASILAAYGATESGGMGCYARADDEMDPVRTSAGRPVPGNEATVLDDEGRPCPPGVEGELVMRSRYHALGEWRDGGCALGPLVLDPADPSLRIHHTGDLVRRTAEGVFLVLGRKDRMVKVNGQRFEPTEIEAAIRRSADVLACAVVALQRGPTTSLAACVVLRPGVSAERLEGVRAAASAVLPSAMVPGRFLRLESLPMLPGGKVDYMALQCLVVPGSGSGPRAS